MMHTIERGQRFLRPITKPIARVATAIAVRGVRGRVDVGAAAKPVHAVVGLTMIEAMLMTPGAQANEMARINNDMHSFDGEIAAAAAAHGDSVAPLPLNATTQQMIDHAKAIGAQATAIGETPIVSLYHAAWLPLWSAWRTFYAANKDGAWWSNPVSEAEKYQDQLIDIRDQATKLGVSLQTPGPKREHPEGLPTWLLPVGVGVGALVVLSIVARGK